MREILQSELDPSGEVVVVESIDRLNVARQGDVWLAEVTASLRFTQDLSEVVAGLQEPGGAARSLTRLGLVMRFGSFEAGETRQYQQRLELIEGRNGWMRTEPRPPSESRSRDGRVSQSAAISRSRPKSSPMPLCATNIGLSRESRRL